MGLLPSKPNRNIKKDNTSKNITKEPKQNDDDIQTSINMDTETGPGDLNTAKVPMIEMNSDGEMEIGRTMTVDPEMDNTSDPTIGSSNDVQKKLWTAPGQ